ncbi:MAG: 5-formyltetrahydrofolate cyclo-ligase [Candidatus Poribacteria bacterium]|nr:5-formyltetrahydrofolate cyclo-ligase [Candidatus Poribacteria bacterium]
MGIAQKRESIRNETLKRRENLSPAERTTRSKLIVGHVIEWIQHNEKNGENSSFNAVMVYFSMKSEVETQELIETLFNQERQIIAPVVGTESGKLVPRCIQNLKKDLVQHRFGMLEPNETCPIFPPDKLQLIFVPGIAFDLNGYRLGYGKGFYDRFLPTCPNAVTIGIAFQEQIVEDMYPQPWDVPVQHIFTEDGLIPSKDVTPH